MIMMKPDVKNTTTVAATSKKNDEESMKHGEMVMVLMVNVIFYHTTSSSFTQFCEKNPKKWAIFMRGHAPFTVHTLYNSKQNTNNKIKTKKSNKKTGKQVT